jgi:predicted nucleic acid-binding protein
VTYLLDTNVLTEVRRPRGAEAVRAWFDSVPSSELFISVLVVGEIRVGIERLRRRDPPQSAVYEHWLDELLRDFARRLIAVDLAVAERWGRIHAAGGSPTIGGLMAASAMVHGLVFVTRNVAHVGRSGVRVLNPWEPSPA